jgi:hypothetical protein
VGEERKVEVRGGKAGVRQLGKRQCSDKERQMLGGKQGRKQESGQTVSRKAEGRRRQGRLKRWRGKGRGQRRKSRREGGGCMVEERLEVRGKEN